MAPAQPEDNSGLLAGHGGSATGGGILYQQKLAAWICSWILSEQLVDQQFGLGWATAEWIRCETEAPVDDVLVKTREGGYIAIQAKVTLNLSASLDSGFGKTVDQFVRHWIVCKAQRNEYGWDRPLDRQVDCLALVVSPRASRPILEDLPKALAKKNSPGGGTLTPDQETALQAFEECIEAAWSRLKSEPAPSQVIEDLCALVRVVKFDPDHSNTAALLQSVAVTPQDAGSIATSLTTICGKFIAERTGADYRGLRVALMAQGARLQPSQTYKHDIDRLKEHTRKVHQDLESYESVQAGNELESIPRDCQAVVNDAALQGPLLIVGEPGVGKSGIINRLAKTLIDAGKDVVQLAVDEYSVETLQGLKEDLRLDKPLIEVLEAWDSPGHGWLIIDALDAARGGKTEGVFRGLIQQVIRKKMRWIVVASIRTFDLELGYQYRDLFTGPPPDRGHSAPRFASTRHVQVRPWSDQELEDLLGRIPALRALIESGGPKLRDVARVPFNTRLLCGLIASFPEPRLGNAISTPNELLRIYWDRRVANVGQDAEFCLRHVVQQMIEAKSLKISKFELPTPLISAYEKLLHQRVLVEPDQDGMLQFSHHLLFDYAASRVYLNLKKDLQKAIMYDKSQALGLMLAPAATFALDDLWTKQADHHDFWLVVVSLLAEKRNDPIIRSVAARLSAELPASEADLQALADLLANGNEAAVNCVSHIVGSLIVQIEDKRALHLDGWIVVAESLVSCIENAEWPLRILCYQLTEKCLSQLNIGRLGTIGRRLLSWGYESNPRAPTVVAAIGFVADTYFSDPAASRALLERVFSEDRFEQYADQEVPALARKIDVLGKEDPEFAAFVIEETFKHRILNERSTDLGNSRILPLRSNSKQDYEAALYGLSQYFPKFLLANPTIATRAMVVAVDGYIGRKHSESSKLELREFIVDSHTYFFRDDYSHIWASNPDHTYEQDAQQLIVDFTKYLRLADERDAINVARSLMNIGRWAIYWSRLFLIGAERADALAQMLWPFAIREEFLMSMDVERSAKALIAAIYDTKSRLEREQFEQSIASFDVSYAADQDVARQHVEGMIFTSIGRDKLVTEHAKSCVNEIQYTDDRAKDFGGFGWERTRQPYFYIEDLDRDLPANAALIKALSTATEITEQLRSKQRPESEFVLSAMLAMRAVRDARQVSGVNVELASAAADTLGEVTERLIASGVIDKFTTQDDVDEFMTYIKIASESAKPVVEDNTEADFEDSAGWGSPAGRISAASASFDILIDRQELYNSLSALHESALRDAHPAVRLNAALRIVRLWTIDEERVWALTEAILERETNTAVLDHFICDVLSKLRGTNPTRAEGLILKALQRVDATGRLRRIKTHLAELLSYNWIGKASVDAFQALQKWIGAVQDEAPLLEAVCQGNRAALSIGLRAKDGNYDDMRRRAQELVHQIVLSANAVLAQFYQQSESGSISNEQASACAKLLDGVCLQLYFAGGGSAADHKAQQEDADIVDQKRYFFEIRHILKDVARLAEAHTSYYLLQTLERQIDVADAEVFDLIAFAMLERGRHIGFQFESLGADLFVRLIGRYMADYKHVFEDSTRRDALIDCLELFIAAGWPSARRLLYRLPEIVQ